MPDQEEAPVAVQEWRPDPGKQVVLTIATRRAERDVRHQQAIHLREQGRSSSEIACQLSISERTVRHWFKRGVAPDTRPRRKRQSDFDPYAPYVLKRWQDGEWNGTRLWEEIAAQGYPGSQRMLYRFLKTLKKTEVKPPGETPQVVHYSSTAAVCLFIRGLPTPPNELFRDLIPQGPKGSADSFLRRATPKMPLRTYPTSRIAKKQSQQ